jgi:tetratricopeptide (TPR) repeat protein
VEARKAKGIEIRKHEMENDSMKEPETPDELLAMHKMLRSDPQQYLRIVNEWIRENPNNRHAYFSRHFAWMKIGEPQRALEDIEKVIALKPTVVSFLSRAHVYRHLGEYEKAIADFNRGEAIDPKEWQDSAFGPFFQADTHARLGNEEAALACCALLPDDFWTPGFEGAPGGGKAEIADELRRRAARARSKRS